MAQKLFLLTDDIDGFGPCSYLSFHVFVLFFFRIMFVLSWKPKGWAVKASFLRATARVTVSHFGKVQAFWSQHIWIIVVLCAHAAGSETLHSGKRKETEEQRFPLCRPRSAGSVLQDWLEQFVYSPLSLESEHIHSDLCLCSSSRSHRTSHRIRF